MIKAELLGGEEVIARLKALPQSARVEVHRTLEELSRRFLRRVADKLSGEVLHTRTGNLRRSIYFRTEQRDGAIVCNAGTPLKYGNAWENGFSRRVGAGARGGPKALKGKALSSYYAKHPPGKKYYEPRSFLRTALAEMTNEMKTEIWRAAGRAADK